MALTTFTFTRQGNDLIGTVDGCKLQAHFRLDVPEAHDFLVDVGPVVAAMAVTRALEEVEADFTANGPQVLERWNRNDQHGMRVEEVPHEQ